MGQERQHTNSASQSNGSTTSSESKEQVEPVDKAGGPGSACEHRRGENSSDRGKAGSKAFDYSQKTDHVSKHKPASDKDVGIRQESNGSKKFKRPKSYIRGRKGNPENRCSSELKVTVGKSSMTSALQGLKNKKPSQLDHISPLDEQELAALDRINCLNKKLKARESTRDYLSSLHWDSSSIDLHPDPPAWSYESYSESERQETSLPGLRSYIRSQEKVKDKSATDRETEVLLSPQESLVSYLDGVVSSRYSLKKCSMGLDPNFNGDQDIDEDFNHHNKQSRMKQSLKTLKETPQGNGGGSLHRTGSAERVKRLVVGVFEEKPEEFSLDLDRGLVLRTSSGGCIQLQPFTHEKINPEVAVESHQPKYIEDDWQQSRKMPSTYPKQGKKKNLSRTNHLVTKENQRSSQNAEQNLKLDSVEALQNSGTLEKRRKSGSPKTYILSSHRDPDCSQSVGRLVIHSGQAVIPILQAQEMPLTVDDGCLIANEDDENNIEITHVDVESPTMRKASTNRRLIVKKNKPAAASIWSSATAVRESERLALCRRFSCDLDEGEFHDSNDEAEVDETCDSDGDDDDDNVDVGGDGDYEDLIIQTELSEGSKVIVSNSDGPIADIKHDKFVNSDTSQSSVSMRSYIPNDEEMITMNNHSIIRAADKSKNNVENDKSTTASLSTVHNKKTCLQTDDRNSSKGIGTKSVSAAKPLSPARGDDRKTKWTNSTRSPPKSSPVSSPETRRREESPREQSRRKNQPSPREEIRIPTSNDGKTRVLLVLRTPPKKGKGSNSAITRDESKMRKKTQKTPSPYRSSPQLSDSKATRGNYISSKLDHGKTSLESSAKGNASRESRRTVENSKRKQNAFGGFSKRAPSASILNDLSPTVLNVKPASPYKTKDKKRQVFRKHTLDSRIPKPCGQLRNNLFSAAEVEDEPEEDEMDDEKDGIDHSFSDGEMNLADIAAINEATVKAHGPCKFSLYHPCRHDLHTPMNTSMTKPKPQFQTKAKGEVYPNPKKIEEDHGPCTFSRFQPCSHVTHSPCHFNQYRPCQHEECEIRLRPEGLVHDVANTTPAAKKVEKTVRPNGYIYGSKKMQDKLGTHSPCVYDKYKPCLHEEVVGPLENLSDIAGVSLLSNAAKDSSKIDVKAKKKEVNPNAESCKFDRFTPCFHENETKFKFNKALGRNVTLHPEKVKGQSTAQTVENVSSLCRYGPFKPCFCHEKLLAMKDSCPETTSNDQETVSAQHVQPSDLKTTSKKANKVDGDLEGVKENTGGKSRKEKGISASRLVRNELARAPAGGSDLKAGPSKPKTNAALGAGEGGVSKVEADSNVAAEGGGQSGAMSLMARITRAWFSSAQAQVARLAPPSRTMVAPALCPDKGLGSNVKPGPNMEVVINKAALGAAVEPYSPLRRPRSKSPLQHDKAAGDHQLLSDTSRGGQNVNARSQQTNDNPFRRLALHEMSLAETGKTFESCETDISQETEIPELSGMTYTRVLSNSNESQYFGRTRSDRSLVAETCSGQLDGKVKPPVTHQLWTGADGVPEDFLVLTSNVFSIGDECGNFEDTANIPSLVNADPEVISADPLPAHFSDLARSHRRRGENGRRMLKDNHEKLHAEQAGLILCHSPQDTPARTWANDGHRCSSSRHDISPRDLLGAGLIQEQLYTKRRIGQNVETLGRGDKEITCGVSPGQLSCGKAMDKSESQHSVHGEEMVDPLSRYRKRNSKKCYPRCVKRKSGQDTPCKLSFQAKRNKSRKFIVSSGANRTDGDVAIQQSNLEDAEKGVSSETPQANSSESPQANTSESSPQANTSESSQANENSPQECVPSKEKEAVVVAAAELSSYQSLLKTLKDMTREESSGQNSTRVKGRSPSYKPSNPRRNPSSSSFPKCEKSEASSKNREYSHTSTESDSSESNTSGGEDSDKSSSNGDISVEQNVTKEGSTLMSTSHLERSLSVEENLRVKSRKMFSTPRTNQEAVKELPSKYCREQASHSGDQGPRGRERGCLSFRVTGLPTETCGDNENMPNLAVFPSSTFDRDLNRAVAGHSVTGYLGWNNFLDDCAEGALEDDESVAQPLGERSWGTAMDDTTDRRRHASERNQEEEAGEESTDDQEDYEEAHEDEANDNEEEEESDDEEEEDDEESLTEEI